MALDSDLEMVVGVCVDPSRRLQSVVRAGKI
jgi:hypothetical protein